MDFRPHGVCSQLIRVDVEDNIVKNVEFIGGCSGNTQGVSRLIRGMDVDEAIARLEGIRMRQQAYILSRPACLGAEAGHRKSIATERKRIPEPSGPVSSFPAYSFSFVFGCQETCSGRRCDDFGPQGGPSWFLNFLNVSRNLC